MTAVLAAGHRLGAPRLVKATPTPADSQHEAARSTRLRPTRAPLTKDHT